MEEMMGLGQGVAVAQCILGEAVPPQGVGDRGKTSPVRSACQGVTSLLPCHPEAAPYQRQAQDGWGRAQERHTCLPISFTSEEIQTAQTQAESRAMDVYTSSRCRRSTTLKRGERKMLVPQKRCRGADFA